MKKNTPGSFAISLPTEEFLKNILTQQMDCNKQIRYQEYLFALFLSRSIQTDAMIQTKHTIKTDEKR